MNRIVILFAPAEQDEDLEQLEVTIVSTKHIALAVNEELDLQKGLIVGSFFLLSFDSIYYNHRVCSGNEVNGFRFAGENW